MDGSPPSEISAKGARRRIEAAGPYVAPGFINVHDHSTPEAPPTAETMLTQGETTAILNPDGSGDLDITKEMADLAKPGMALNVGAYAGFNALWEAVVGQKDAGPSEAQIVAMRNLVEKNLGEGAFGVSAGLDYQPAYFARPGEVVSVVSAASKWRTNFPNPDRLTPESGYNSRLRAAETISIASAAGLSLEITHIQAQGREHGRAGEILEMTQRPTAAGRYTPGDVYPYAAGVIALFRRHGAGMGPGGRAKGHARDGPGSREAGEERGQRRDGPQGALRRRERGLPAHVAASAR